MQKVVLPSSVDQALFATSEKFSIPFTSLTGARLPFLNRSREASKGPAGDEIARRSAGKTRIESGVVLGRRIGLELNLDVGVRLVEGRNDLGVPDIRIVIAPALDRERLGRGGIRESKSGRGHRSSREQLSCAAQESFRMKRLHRLCPPLTKGAWKRLSNTSL
jgi:hypothetical protein